MIKVCLVNFGLVINSVGGAERVLANLANGLRKRGICISVVACEDKEGNLFYPLDKDVKFYNIHQNKEPFILNRVLRKILKLYKIDYKYIANKDSVDVALRSIFVKENVNVIINFFPQHLSYVLKNRPKDVAVIQMLHSSFDYLKNLLVSTNDIAYFNRINEVDVLQVLLPSYKEQVNKEFSVRTEVIPNIVPRLNRCIYGKKIVYLSRYDTDKRVHLLIQAFSKISNEFSDWQLHIYGMEMTKGYKQKCKKIVNDFGLHEKVFLNDAIDDINTALSDASICGFPSKFEGFSLALTEAMSAGLPCIGFKSCSGVNELIEDGYNGFLVEEDVNDFADKMAYLMKNPEICKKMGDNAIKSVEKYSEKNIIDQWMNLILEISKKNTGI